MLLQVGLSVRTTTRLLCDLAVPCLDKVFFLFDGTLCFGLEAVESALCVLLIILGGLDGALEI